MCNTNITCNLQPANYTLRSTDEVIDKTSFEVLQWCVESRNKFVFFTSFVKREITPHLLLILRFKVHHAMLCIKHSRQCLRRHTPLVRLNRIGRENKSGTMSPGPNKTTRERCVTTGGKSKCRYTENRVESMTCSAFLTKCKIFPLDSR